MADFTIKQNDRQPVFSAILKDPNDAVVDLTTAVSASLRMRRSGERAHVIGTMTIGSPKTNGKVTYQWAAGDTFITGESMEAVIVVEWPGSSYQTFPTEGYISVDVTDNIDVETADLNEDIVVPDATPQLYGDGYWPWTPTVMHDGAPVTGASVTVISDVPETFGPATTNAQGKCIASDGAGAFRLDPGTFTVTTTSGGVTKTEVLVIDENGNGVLT